MYQLISRDFCALHYGTHQESVDDVHTYEATPVEVVSDEKFIYR